MRFSAGKRAKRVDGAKLALFRQTELMIEYLSDIILGRRRAPVLTLDAPPARRIRTTEQENDGNASRIRTLRGPLRDARGQAHRSLHRRRSARCPDGDGLFSLGGERPAAHLRHRHRLY